MSENLRIGLTIGPSDPFWVEVREAILEAAQQAGLQIISLELDPAMVYTAQEEIYAAEELIAQQIHILIDYGLSEKLILEFLNSGGSVIFLNESDIQHPRFVSPRGLHQAGKIAGEFFASIIPLNGRILLAGPETDGHSRIDGFMDVIKRRNDLKIMRCETGWKTDEARSAVTTAFISTQASFDGIYGLSDTIALAAKDALLSIGLILPETPVVGINGDPLALAAIAKHKMSATVMTSAQKLAHRAVELAQKALMNEALPDYYSYEPYLVTFENVAETAAQKLLDIAEIPGRMVGFNRQHEQARLKQMELVLDLNRHIGTSLQRFQLIETIGELFQARLRFTSVRFLAWDAAVNTLWQEYPVTKSPKESLESPVWSALETRQPVLLHKMQAIEVINGFTQLIIPVFQSEKIVGLLDLTARETVHISQQQLLGLQILASQFGIALQNAELYSEAIHARKQAEQADSLKTHLLANVSHELRTPISVIMGYSQTAIQNPDLYGIQLPADLLQDLNYISQSAGHLLRLINDLLDLSRAEVDLLQMNFEAVETSRFLQETLTTFLGSVSSNPALEWSLEISSPLPFLQIDKTRIRQVIFNLLSNAFKFTTSGKIELGADVIPPYVHLWVKDTGTGIPPEIQEKVFDSFFTAGQKYGKEGVGLGLTITRKLVSLHYGYITLESQVGEGTTFHIYLPLPGLDGQFAPPISGNKPVMIVISHNQKIPAQIAEIGRKNLIEIQLVSDFFELDAVLSETQARVLAWDMTNQSPQDWEIIQKIRTRPEACTIPFLMYQHGQDAPDSNELLSVLTKPAASKTILEHIAAFQPTNNLAPFLVVDDDLQTCTYYAKILQQHFPGCEVQMAHNGIQGLEKLALNRPCLIILDLVMPEMDGFEFVQRLKENTETRFIPVIILSGKLLSKEDVVQLQKANVVFETKQILTDDELISQILSVKTGENTLHFETSALIKQAIAYIMGHYANDLSRHELAQQMGISQDYLSRIFHKEIGISPWEFINRYRVIKARELLEKTNHGITAIALQVGFNDPAYFSRVFQKINGCSAKVYRERMLRFKQ